MKKYFLLFALAFFLVTCQEEVSFNNPGFEGQKNGVFWRAASVNATLQNGSSLLIQATKGKETIFLETSSPNPNRYELGINDANRVLQEVTEGPFPFFYATGIGYGSGNITITEYDKVNKTISGTFKYSAASNGVYTADPFFVFFQYGYFYKIPIIEPEI